MAGEAEASSAVIDRSEGELDRWQMHILLDT
jgi:hypothetical protein